MTTPNVPPRQPGETPYAYRLRRSLALTGETPYQRRIRLGQGRGQHGTPAIPGLAPAESEYERRNRLSIQQYGETITQRRNRIADTWLAAHGYTAQATGMSQTALRHVYPRLKWINEQTTKNYTIPGAPITPDLIRDAIELEKVGEYERGWVTDRIFKRYDSMVEFMQGRRFTGNWYWFNEGGASADKSWQLWWYYH